MKTTAKYLRAGEVAQRLGISLTTVRTLAKRGVLPALRISTQLTFRAEDVEAYLAAARVHAAASE